jgi:hypothetical protein
MNGAARRILQKHTCLIALLVLFCSIAMIAEASINFPASSNHDHIITDVASLSSSEIRAFY